MIKIDFLSSEKREKVKSFIPENSLLNTKKIYKNRCPEDLYVSANIRGLLILPIGCDGFFKGSAISKKMMEGKSEFICLLEIMKENKNISRKCYLTLAFNFETSPDPNISDEEYKLVMKEHCEKYSKK